LICAADYILMTECSLQDWVPENGYVHCTYCQLTQFIQMQTVS